MYTVRNLNGQVVLATAKTERAAIAAGRRNQRETAKFGGAAEGFKVYDDTNQLIRIQVCDNFGNHWREQK